MNQQTKRCIACGKVFTKNIFTSKKRWDNKRRFCSKKCGDIAGHKKHTKDWKDRMSKYHKTHSNSGRFKKGFTPWNKGKEYFQIRGEKHPQWKGGISYEKYSVNWTETLRRSIRERDIYVCKLCGKPQGDIAHDVHHIDYDKKNCSPENLITLCHQCHTKTNHNRDYWIRKLNN